MSREWKPGDVAMVTADNHPTPYRAYYDGRDETWRKCDSPSFCVDGPPSIRPLVLIDPESVVFEGESDDDENRIPEIVNCLRRIAEADGGRTWRAKLCLRLADEFDRQARPPKPAEPTGLGAVVEDATGERWIRAARIAHGWHRPMGTWRAYGEIDAVRVLSEGVTQ